MIASGIKKEKLNVCVCVHFHQVQEARNMCACVRVCAHPPIAEKRVCVCVCVHQVCARACVCASKFTRHKHIEGKESKAFHLLG